MDNLFAKILQEVNWQKSLGRSGISTHSVIPRNVILPQRLCSKLSKSSLVVYVIVIVALVPFLKSHAPSVSQHSGAVMLSICIFWEESEKKLLQAD